MNAFLAFAEQHVSSPTRARQRAAEQRARNKALQERDRLFRLWLKHQEKLRDELLAGPHGDAARELIEFTKTMTAEQASELIALIERGPWRSTDDDTRFLVLQLVDSAITYLRERHDLAPFDDALPYSDGPPNAFLIIRELLA